MTPVITPLEQNIRNLLKQKEILLISHAVLGYPSFKANEEAIKTMMEAGIEVIELQIPFSDPQADGPFFTMANQKSLDNNTKVADCLIFANNIAHQYPQVNFLFMTYYNILFKYGIDQFVAKTASSNIKGIIIPDLPLEESKAYIEAGKKYQVANIFMFTPTTTIARMQAINEQASGFIYCQARTGVTGKQTIFTKDSEDYIQRCRESTNLPLAMGFGITQKADVDFLKGKVDLAICCTQAVKISVEQGNEAMGNFLINLR